MGIRYLWPLHTSSKVDFSNKVAKGVCVCVLEGVCISFSLSVTVLKVL